MREKRPLIFLYSFLGSRKWSAESKQEILYRFFDLEEDSGETFSSFQDVL